MTSHMTYIRLEVPCNIIKKKLEEARGRGQHRPSSFEHLDSVCTVYIHCNYNSIPDAYPKLITLPLMLPQQLSSHSFRLATVCLFLFVYTPAEHGSYVLLLIYSL